MIAVETKFTWRRLEALAGLANASTCTLDGIRRYFARSGVAIDTDVLRESLRYLVKRGLACYVGARPHWCKKKEFTEEYGLTETGRRFVAEMGRLLFPMYG